MRFALLLEVVVVLPYVVFLHWILWSSRFWFTLGRFGVCQHWPGDLQSLYVCGSWRLCYWDSFHSAGAQKIRRGPGPWGQPAAQLRACAEFFYFYIFFDLSKIYVAIFFFQKCHPAAGWFGGKELPPVHPAVRSLAHGAWKIPPVQTAVAPYRQTNRR